MVDFKSGLTDFNNRRLTGLERLADRLGVLTDRNLCDSIDVYRDELLATVLEKWCVLTATEHFDTNGANLTQENPVV